MMLYEPSSVPLSTVQLLFTDLNIPLFNKFLTFFPLPVADFDIYGDNNALVFLGLYPSTGV